MVPKFSTAPAAGGTAILVLRDLSSLNIFLSLHCFKVKYGKSDHLEEILMPVFL